MTHWAIVVVNGPVPVSHDGDTAAVESTKVRRMARYACWREYCAPDACE